MEFKNLTKKSIEEAQEFAAQYGKNECLFWLGVLGRIVKAKENEKGINQFEKIFLDRDYIRSGIQKHWGRTMEKLKDLDAFTAVTDLVVSKFMETHSMFETEKIPLDNRLFHIMAGYTYFSGPKSWGGKREGAGRPPTGRKKHTYYVTEAEDSEIRILIEKMREE